MNTETNLYEQVTNYLNLKYPNIIYHWDLSGLWTPSHKARNLYGRLNSRAYPDLFVALACPPYHGLFLELKREGTQMYKKDGSLRANSHFEEQANMLEMLRNQGYAASFSIGFDQTIGLLDTYISGSYTQL